MLKRLEEDGNECSGTLCVKMKVFKTKECIRVMRRRRRRRRRGKDGVDGVLFMAVDGDSEEGAPSQLWRKERK